MYKINNIDKIDSPALVLYPDKIAENIRQAIDIAGSVNKLRPHVKTNKMSEVCEMMMHSGITKFKCATIAEAEMLAMIDAPDVLLAYQPVGPKVERLLKLIKVYQKTNFSCLLDSTINAYVINELCLKEHITLDIYIDLNIGMNRTGILPIKAVELAKNIRSFSNLRLIGIHGYDGHIHDNDYSKRVAEVLVSSAKADTAYNDIQPLFTYPLVKIMGGTPTFNIYSRKNDCECSPGTFVFWDWGYKQMMPELPFEYAALLISRVISIIDEEHICIDLGYKSIAAEMPLPRIHFLNEPEAKPVSQSEEHLVLKVPESSNYHLGDVLYGAPIHICPTVALYEKAFIVKDGNMTDSWNVIARNRYINY